MKKTAIALMWILSAMMFVGCGGSKTPGDSTEIDSLRAKVESMQKQMESSDLFLETMNSVMDSVILADGNMILTGAAEGVTPSREKMKQNIEAYKIMLNRQKERVAQLQEALADQNSENAQKIKALTSQMQAQIDAKDAQIADLQKQLADSNVSIDALLARVNQLNKAISNYRDENLSKDITINKQTKQLNEAYYAIGSKKELKAKGLMTGGNLFKKSKLDLSEADKANLTRIDIRNKTTFDIPSGSAKILTQAPSDSYTLTKIDKNNSRLTITDIQKFWSLSNVLVVEY